MQKERKEKKLKTKDWRVFETKQKRNIWLHYVADECALYATHVWVRRGPHCSGDRAMRANASSTYTCTAMPQCNCKTMK